MKKLLSFIAIAILIVSSSWINHAMKNEKAIDASVKESALLLTPDFTTFRTHRQGKDGVTTVWSLSSENGVMGYTVLRTYEDPTDPYAFWETVTQSPCRSARSYKHTDDNVFPGYISYCVVANMSGGGEVISPVSTIRILSH